MRGSCGVRVDRPAPRVLRICLHRPEKRNALDSGVVGRLLEVIAEAGDDIVVLTSTDADCFCAGVDLTLNDGERALVSDRLYELYGCIVRLRQPVIVAVGGKAIGGGAQLAVAGDFRVGSRSTLFRFVGPGHGLAVGGWALPSLVGRGRALDLALTMRWVGAQEALRIGLLDRVDAAPEAVATELAASLCELDSDAVARSKATVHRATGLLSALDSERAGNRSWSGSLQGLVDGREPSS